MSRWESFSLTAAARPTKVAGGPSDVYIAMPLPEEAAAFLTLTPELDDMFLPLVDLGSIDKFSEQDLNKAFSVIEDVTTSIQEPVDGVFPTEYGISKGTVWVRPSVESLDTIQSRLDAGLSQHQLKGTALSDLTVEVAENVTVDPDYTLRTPQTFAMDRLALVVGDDVYEFPFGSLSSSAVMASGEKSELTYEDDALEHAPDLRDADITKDLSGAKFRIPLVVPEGVSTGDSRVFESGALETRDLPCR